MFNGYPRNNKTFEPNGGRWNIQREYLVTFQNMQYGPDHALIVRNICIEILLLFVLLNATKYSRSKC